MGWGVGCRQALQGKSSAQLSSPEPGTDRTPHPPARRLSEAETHRQTRPTQQPEFKKSRTGAGPHRVTALSKGTVVGTTDLARTEASRDAGVRGWEKPRALLLRRHNSRSRQVSTSWLSQGMAASSHPAGGHA